MAKKTMDRQKIINDFTDMVTYSCQNCKYGPAYRCEKAGSYLKAPDCIMVEMRAWGERSRAITDKIKKFLSYLKPETE